MRYIGSKVALIENINILLQKHIFGFEESFFDLFGGTNVVGNYFKKDYLIYSNDILYFSYVNSRAIIQNNNELTFHKLREAGISNPLEYLQDNADELNYENSNYYEKAYTPTGGSMYFSVDNGKRIDYIRDTIELWKTNELISDDEYYYLLSCLIESIPYVSNTTGTYGAYLKHWDKRALKPLKLIPLEIKNNNRNNISFNEDSNTLIKKVKADIVYIDTPYNTRQYASNYHVLENIARNCKPKLSGKTKVFDWSDLRSTYAMKRSALKSMEDLIENIDATHIILSYNTDGIITVDELTNLLKKYAVDGKVEIEYIDYRKYRSKIASKEKKLNELLFYIQRKSIKSTKSKREKTKVKTEQKRWSAVNNDYIKSPLNYIGGKYKLLSQIIPLFPKDINCFVDLFSGGANVGINVNAKKYIFNDMNNRINEMFRFFSKNNPDTLISMIKNRIAEYGLSKENEEAYQKFRCDYNTNPNPLDFYILVAYSYNYQIRFNNSMQFNNPFGRNRSHFSYNMERNLRKFVSKLQTIDATFVDKLFVDLDLSFLSKEDFVYLDPPYLITTGNYNDGNRGFLNWGSEQELEMYKLMDKLTEKGIRWALSNVIEHKGHSNNYLKDYIDKSDVIVNYLDFSYTNSSHNTARKSSKEVLITNYDIYTYKILNSKKHSK